MVFTILQCIGIVLIIIYAIVPLILRIIPSIFSKIIFLDFVCNFRTNLDKPEKFKFTYRNWQNIRITNSFSNCELGAWKILSKNDEITNTQNQLEGNDFSDRFSNGNPIILYLHGNSMHRGSHHRLLLYHVLRESGYHIMTIDYRGFGDSSGSINNEDDALEDAYVAFKYLRSIAPNSLIFIWGHSLGSGISSLLLKKLSKMNECSSVAGVILESPFTSVVETMDYICLTLPWRFMPYFNRIFKQSLFIQKLAFNSIENLKDVNVPIFILHAEDDKVLSFQMGKKLYLALCAVGKDVSFKGFNGNLGFGHDYIVNCPELPDLIKKFTSKATTLKTNSGPLSFEKM